MYIYIYIYIYIYTYVYTYVYLCIFVYQYIQPAQSLHKQNFLLLAHITHTQCGIDFSDLSFLRIHLYWTFRRVWHTISRKLYNPLPLLLGGVGRHAVLYALRWVRDVQGQIVLASE